MSGVDHPRWRRAMLLIGQSRLDLAEGELRQLLTDEPNHSRAHAFLAYCLAASKEEEATDEARQAVHLAPDDPFAHQTLAEVLLHRDRYREAEQAIRESIRLDPSRSSAHETHARIHFAQGYWSNALAAAERGLEAGPNDAECSNMKALALVNLGEPAQAQAVTERTLEQHPENAQTHASRGWALLAQELAHEAMLHFREALRIKPNDAAAREGLVEALKLQNAFYRAALTASMWLSQCGIRFQCFIGFIAISMFAIALEIIEKNPKQTFRITLLAVPYAIFVAFVWAPDALANVLMRLHRDGRHALSRPRRVAAVCVGVFLAAAIVLLVAALLSHESSLLIGALACGAIIFPLSSIFDCERGWPQNLTIAVTVALAALGAAIFVAAGPVSPLEIDSTKGLVALFVIAAALSRAAANFFVRQVVKK